MDQPWETTQTQRNINRLMAFYRALDADISVCRDSVGEKPTWTAYINDVPVQYAYATPREALRAADEYRWNRAESLRPDGWKCRQRRFVNVNQFDTWTPDDAVRDVQPDGETRLVWS